MRNIEKQINLLAGKTRRKGYRIIRLEWLKNKSPDSVRISLKFFSMEFLGFDTDQL